MGFEFETMDPGEVLPDRIGHYRVIHKLGAGGFGDVYFVRRDGSNSPLALKVLATQNIPATWRKEAESRFRTEAHVPNDIDHPGIIRTVDAGVDDLGRCYIAMEYVQGTSFSKHFDARRNELAAGRLTKPELYREIAFLGEEVASAMVAAHGKGVFHRDLKPDNVMVVRDRFALRQLRVKILDFGIAKVSPEILAMQARAGATPHWTRAGAVMGTRPYMAPEQYGEPDKVTGKADVHALGIMLYEVLSGLNSDQISDPPVPLSQLDASISALWQGMIDRMIAPKAAHRPDMDEVRYTLQQFAQEDAEFAQAVFAWEGSHRTAVATGKTLERFLGWAKGRHLNEDEAEFLRASSAANTELERQFAQTELGKQEALVIAAEARVKAEHGRKMMLWVALTMAVLGLVACARLWRDADNKRAELEQARTDLENQQKVTHDVVDAEAKSRKDLEGAQSTLGDLERGNHTLTEQVAQLKDAVAKLESSRNFLSGANAALRASNDELRIARDAALDAKQRAEGERDAAQRAKVIAEGERDAANVAKQRAENARVTAEGDRDAAVAARGAAERAQAVAERAKVTAEGDRDAAVAARGAAELAKAAADSAKTVAELAKAAAENAKARVEVERDAARARCSPRPVESVDPPPPQ